MRMAMTTMMTIAMIGLLLLLAGSASAADLNGQTITVTGGKADGQNVPVTVECDGGNDGLVVSAVDKAGKKYPGTVRNGELTLVLDAVPAHNKLELTVQTAPKPADYKQRVELKKKDGADVIDVTIDGVFFTSYYYSNENFKPYLWPIMSEGQVTVTRDWPMKEIENPTGSEGKDATDHKHHKSMWSAFGEIKLIKSEKDLAKSGKDNQEGKVGFTDCWMEEKEAGYQHSGEVTFGSGDAYGWIHAKNVWQTHEHEPIVTEEREYRFYASPENARLVDVRLVFSPDYGDVRFGDTKEGGLVSLRMRPDICKDKAIITNEFGEQGEDKCWGKPSRWCDFSGDIPGTGLRGLAVLDHPDNLRYPSSWHVRNYGLMGANVFGYSYFREKEYNKSLPENGDFILKKGKPLPMNYRVYVHGGNAETAKVNDQQVNFATPPKAVLK